MRAEEAIDLQMRRIVMSRDSMIAGVMHLSVLCFLYQMTEIVLYASGVHSAIPPEKEAADQQA
jgi:hypothetical protein